MCHDQPEVSSANDQRPTQPGVSVLRDPTGGGTMTLPVTNLDDRTFQDIVDEAKRLIPSFCPEWTNHNVSDPGVALIELFAWMSEMIIFRLNQTPDKLYTQFLNLLGVRPYPAQAATVDLTFWLSAATESAVVVP